MNRRKFDLTQGIRQVIQSPSSESPGTKPSSKPTSPTPKSNTQSTSTTPAPTTTQSTSTTPAPTTTQSTSTTPAPTTTSLTTLKIASSTRSQYEQKFTKIRLRHQSYEDLKHLCKEIPGLSIQDAVEMSLRELLNKKDPKSFLCRQAKKYLNRF